jgi:Skp family chaperone for outer membrane proteins
MGNTEPRWYQEFTGDLQEWSDKHHLDNLNKARDAVASVAKAQGYTLVFDKSVAPYGANDLTDAALQAMNAQK